MKTKILILSMLLLTGVATGFAQSGKCGENLTWRLSNDKKTLTISGTGEMTNYFMFIQDAPWYSYRSSITTVEIGDGVTSIGQFAFYECSSLTSITIPDGVTRIGERAFFDCSSLTSITIPNRVTSIGGSAFYGCSSLTSITIPEGVKSIGSSAFYDCSSLTSITIPDGVTSIGSTAFASCRRLTSITIPNSVTWIGECAFQRCYSLISITIPDGVTSIELGTFEYCSRLTSITIPDGVTSIGYGAFGDCRSLTSITIPDGVTSIGEYAFDVCSSLTSITIPNSVTGIGYGAFNRCSSLEDVYVGWATPIDISYLVFSDVDVASCTLHVPAGTEALYRKASVWRNFHITASAGNPSGLTPVETSAIGYGNGILTVHTPQSERIEVYSVSGQLLYGARKDAGKATFDLNSLPRGVLIVRGGSGWVKKIVN